MSDGRSAAPLPATDTIFAVAMSNLKFGVGALDEIGSDAAARGMNRVALFTDRHVAGIESFACALASLRRAGLDVAVFDEVRVEPTDSSFRAAATFAHEAGADGIVSIGGGSVIDTAKAANLLSCHPADILTYVNAPVGAGQAVPGPCLPHIACPTTSGTGSECTGVAICDFEREGVKSGVSSPYLKPTLAVVDPTTTHSLPAGVVASTGFDVLTHAIESYTAKPYDARPRPAAPKDRAVYQGTNPWSDIGSAEAIRLGGRYLERAVADAGDLVARHNLMFAATLAGLAFGNAGVHIPHAMSYAVAGLRHTFHAHGYEGEAPGVPHGISVVVNAPACFRLTGPTAPERHLQAARWLGTANADGADEEGDVDGKAAGALLADRLATMMRATGIPNGLTALGYSDADIPSLAQRALAQQRLLVNAPCHMDQSGLERLFRDAMSYW